jgi:ATP-binding cassette subfamily B protein
MWRRYPLVRQNDGNDCGAAALATLALYHRKPSSLERLRDLSGTDRSGANLLGLVRAAEKLGFSAKAVRCGSYDSLAALPLPAIAHVCDGDGNGHFVVLYRTTRGGVMVGDPIGFVEERSRERFGAQWTGNLLLAVPDASASASALDQSVTPLRRFLRLLMPHWPILLEVVVCALLMTLLAISNSYFVQHLVDSVLVRDERRLLNALGLGMLCVVVFRSLFGLVRQYLLAHVGRKIDLAIIGRYTRHVLRLPMRFFENRRVGEILARVTDASKLREAINGTTTTALVDAIVVVSLLAVLWLYDAPLATATSLVIPLFLITVALNHSAARTTAQRAMEQGAQLSAHLIEDVSGVETIKAFGAEDGRAEQGEARLVSFVQSLFDLQKLDIRLSSLTLLITGLAGLGILWYGGHRVLDGALTIGQLLFFYTLLATMLDPLNRLATVNLKMQDALVAVDRLFQILDLEREPVGDDKIRFAGVRNEIELRDVSFGYGSRGLVLNQISMRIPAGRTTAIVGESGSGKSTLLKLLMNYYQPTSGRVFVDGTDLRDFELASYRAGLGVVTQDTFVFNGTIRDNIALARPDASLDEIIDVARAAGLDDFISGLPQRYDTVIGERGANLSGGQRQRLAIARALLHRPQVLIFDEATSHLDTATEQAIQRNLKTRLAGCTVILVAHRLSTIRDADVIYVIDKGQIIEQGSHQRLVAQNGRYAALWKTQHDGAGRRDCRCHQSLNGKHLLASEA